MNVKSFLLFLFLLSFGESRRRFIIPEDLPSALSIIFSLPPVKKGTDSRVGFGFAFGNHADFQLMFELGPQNKTQPLNGQGFQQTSSNTKRQAPAPPKLNKNREKLLQSDASNYLQNWAQKIKHAQKHSPPALSPQLGDVPNLKGYTLEHVKNEKGEIRDSPATHNLPEHVLENLKKPVRQKSEAVKKIAEKCPSEKQSEAEVKRNTENLSHINLD